MQFKNKFTESKLLNISALGPNLFGNRFFEILHGSAENMRSARETQFVRFKNPVKRTHEESTGVRADYYPSSKRPRTNMTESFRTRKDSKFNSQKFRQESKRTGLSKDQGFRPFKQ